MHPKPLPHGKLEIEHLNIALKKYPHVFHDLGAELTINDTALLLRNLTGHIDSSDFRLSGRVNNYALWFDRVKKGKTLIAFDLKSQRLALREILGRRSRKYLPKEYANEIFTGVWLRSKSELKYDSVFKFANVRIANISGQLSKHPYQLDSIHGNIKFNADNFIKIDTLQGKIGNSDFNISMRLYTGKDTVRSKKENYLQFASRFLDVNQLMNYAQTATDELMTQPSAESDPQQGDSVSSTIASDTKTAHKEAFNIFSIPFINFNASVDIGKIRYRRLGLKNLSHQTAHDGQPATLPGYILGSRGGRQYWSESPFQRR